MLWYFRIEQDIRFREREKKSPGIERGGGETGGMETSNGCFFQLESKLKIETWPIATDHKVKGSKARENASGVKVFPLEKQNGESRENKFLKDGAFNVID